ncbi:hypothetical protein SPI_09390 [Niveomyces insectorum RCEF 264]|uniref:Uncharacterized protein n=1 Tax=Niveomyces insectorum RCEF 264 TaxID=1081102 RepID=A0A167LSX1_9HYPO|nr:hypothetical protein SPI_09390 [Niveomyces insectorum RCEF 264]
MARNDNPPTWTVTRDDTARQPRSEGAITAPGDTAVQADQASHTGSTIPEGRETFRAASGRTSAPKPSNDNNNGDSDGDGGPEDNGSVSGDEHERVPCDCCTYWRDIDARGRASNAPGGSSTPAHRQMVPLRPALVRRPAYVRQSEPTFFREPVRARTRSPGRDIFRDPFPDPFPDVFRDAFPAPFQDPFPFPLSSSGRTSSGRGPGRRSRRDDYGGGFGRQVIEIEIEHDSGRDDDLDFFWPSRRR